MSNHDGGSSTASKQPCARRTADVTIGNDAEGNAPTLHHLSKRLVAKCEEGYLCDVCGGDVESLAESDLYLRYVIGLIDPETLHTTRERHIRCNPTLAQFIVDAGFEPVVMEGPFDKRQLDPAYVREREQLVTRGWRRLVELDRRRPETILEYPLPEVQATWR
jgi:hypothetical protein